jgi:large subunit ribosomal protein LP0
VQVPAGAKAGTLAPTDVFVPPGPTGLDPGQTGFFQALNIATKIVKGSIEIVAQVHLIKKGDKITSSAVALLSKLDIKPFFYGQCAFRCT